MNYLFEEMVKRALQGEQKAVEELLMQLRPLVLAYSRRYGGRQGMDEDAFQEGMLEILGGLKDYDVSRNIPFLAYITTRIRYYYHNRRRREKLCYSLEEKVGIDAAATFLDFLVDPDGGVEEACIDKEKHRLLKVAMEQLTECQREIITQYYFQWKSQKDIAAEKGIHPVSVAKTKAAAIKKMKKYFQEVY